MKTKILIPAVLLLLATSCQKEESSTNCDKTVASIAGTYSIQKFEVRTNGVFLNVTSQLDPCQLDDKLSLNLNGTTTYVDLGVVCSPSGNSNGNWSISSTGKMTIDDNGGTADISTADITSYDCSTLVLTGFDSSSPGDQFRLTLKKQ